MKGCTSEFCCSMSVPWGTNESVHEGAGGVKWWRFPECPGCSYRIWPCLHKWREQDSPWAAADDGEWGYCSPAETSKLGQLVHICTKAESAGLVPTGPNPTPVRVNTHKSCPPRSKILGLVGWLFFGWFFFLILYLQVVIKKNPFFQTCSGQTSVKTYFFPAQVALTTSELYEQRIKRGIMSLSLHLIWIFSRSHCMIFVLSLRVALSLEEILALLLNSVWMDFQQKHQSAESLVAQHVR